MTVSPTDEDEQQMFDGEAADVSAGQQIKEVFYEGFVAPAKIALSDWRTLMGISIIGFFVSVGFLVQLQQWGYAPHNTVLNAVGSPWTLQDPLQYSCETYIEGPNRGENIPGSCTGFEHTGTGPFTNWETPLGTDNSGRGILSAILWGTPYMLKMIAAGGVFSIAMATLVGTVAGYKGGIVEQVLMTATDIALSIPGLPLVIVLVGIFDPTSPYLIGVLITVNVWAGLARTIQSQVLTLREQSYVEASRTMGVSTGRIIQKDILPNLMPYIMVNFVYSARRVIYDSVALFYLGFLASQTRGNWGKMLNDYATNRGAINAGGDKYLIIIPMVPIVLLSLGFILFTQGTDRLFNPRVRTRHEGETVEDEEEKSGDIQPSMV